MDNIFNNKAFKDVTIFEFGYIAEPQQFEVRHIRFHIVYPKGQSSFEAATFVKRGKRKEQTVAVNQLVVIEGWAHPRFEPHTTHVNGKAKFSFGSNSWNNLLDEHLASMVPPFKLIFDGRKRPRLTNKPKDKPTHNERQNFFEVVQKIPSGAAERRWNLRADYRCSGGSHCHSRAIKLSESPLYLELNWHLTATDPVQRVGIFRFELNDLLHHGYTRLDKPDKHGGPCVRLRVFRSDNGNFYIQTKQGNPELLIAANQTQPAVPQDSVIDDLPSPPIGAMTPNKTASTSFRYQRDEEVRDFVVERAKGACEYCGELGFVLLNGSRYLEAHHIISLAEQGPDTVDNVIALCPSDHREAHYGKKAIAMESEMKEIIKKRNGLVIAQKISESP